MIRIAMVKKTIHPFYSYTINTYNTHMVPCVVCNIERAPVYTGRKLFWRRTLNNIFETRFFSDFKTQHKHLLITIRNYFRRSSTHRMFTNTLIFTFNLRKVLNKPSSFFFTLCDIANKKKTFMFVFLSFSKQLYGSTKLY